MRARTLLVVPLLLAARVESGEVVAGTSVFGGPRGPAEEKALRRVLEAYVRAIEGKDIDAFRAVKPNLTAEEERRAKKAFESLQSQAIVMTVASADVQESTATIRVNRRDTINGSIVSAFPQTFLLARGREGWSIQEIGGR